MAITKPMIPDVGKVKPAVMPKPTVAMDQASKDARFIRDMEANKSLHDAGRLDHYVELQQKNPNAVFGNADLQRFYNQKVGVQQPNTPTAPTAQQPAFDQNAFLSGMQGNINSMYDAQKQAQLAAMRAQRDKAVGDINLQKQNVAPQYQGMRNQADVTNQQNVQRLRELMASNGLNASGENVTANVSLSNERQNSLNTLNLQEQQTMNDFNKRIADLNDPSNEQALTASLDAERSRALLDAYNRANDVGYQRSTDQRNFDYQKALDTWNQNHTTQRDQVGDKQWSDQFNYGKSQDAIQNQQWNTTRNDNLKQQAADNAWRQYQYSNMSAAEKAQFAQNASQFGEDMAWKYYQNTQSTEAAKATSQAELDFYKKMGFNQPQGGGDYYKTAQAGNSSNFKQYQSDLQQAVKLGVPTSWAPALTELVGRESSWNPKAKNPNSTAFGYGQFLNSTVRNYAKDGLDYGNPVHQLVMMAQYVKDRYGSPDKALAFWDKNHYY